MRETRGEGGSPSEGRILMGRARETDLWEGPSVKRPEWKCGSGGGAEGCRGNLLGHPVLGLVGSDVAGTPL